MKSTAAKAFKNILHQLVGLSRRDSVIESLTKDLELANKKLKVLSNATGDAIWDWDITTNEIIWNDGRRAIFGYNDGAATTTYNSWYDNIHPCDRDVIIDGLKQVFDQGKAAWKALYRFRCSNGSYKYTYTRGHVLYNNLKPIRLIGAMQDIDERMTTLQEVEKLSLVASKTENLVIITDANEKIEWVNEGFTKRMGYSFGEVIGKTREILQGKETDQVTVDRINQHLSAGKSVTEEILNYTKQGEKIWLRTNITPVLDEHHHVLRVIAVETDITELTEYRNSLELKVRERTEKLERAVMKEKELVELKNQFVAIASHEFRTPLSTINFATNYLSEHFEKLGAAEVRSKLEKIEKQVAHMTSLLDDVIMAGRTELNKIPCTRSFIKLAPVIHKIIEDVQQASKGTHQINFQFDEKINVVETDEKLLRNIFINVLTNAIKFSPNAKNIDLTVNHINNALVIQVTDKGIGIPEVDQEKLFTAFQRGSNTKSIAGTGLGLTIVKKAVDVLNGNVMVKSKVNQGTTVTITLPVRL